MNNAIPKNLPQEPITSARVWGADTVFEGVVHTFSDATQREVADYVKGRVSDGVLSHAEIERVEYDPSQLPRLVEEIESVRPQVDTGMGFVVFPAWAGLNIHQSRVASWLVDNAFGDPKVQDDVGSHLIQIFNMADDRSMRTGARYHETREGNSPHTDGPQVLSDPDYLCLRCVSDGWIGGENILVTADSIYNHLLEHAPHLIRVLAGDYLFHCRGVDNVDGREYFARPILSMDDGGLRLRFLDHYIESGHRLAKQPLTLEQRKAIDYLNCLFELAAVQFRARLEPGQQVVFANKRMLHARTEFLDRHDAREIYDPRQLDDVSTANRLMDRTWSYKRQAPASA